ncbi:molybdopterin synthase sulfur carrier subunit [Tatumella citrea]|uniref:Molybdopterin synthase sulfur carrier subunit n=1 Tax=Tatumella citrea TaxID=53336 RepID=A0A1Y0LIK4_TATCI|nr:molybdopterin synthase sulfur carrier subunit [Tatumella citrea]ARU93451.1 molybdopterin synthase sulfur carrier subunit [Tatumella citrea]ARU97490.1 molybdopterin synthase sulfur carrier subunit [Tatumella citrea]
MINILLFARVRELAGSASLEVPFGFSDVESLRQALSDRDKNWALAMEKGKLLAAVNQTLVPFSHPLQDGDEVAFFPPVTGG